MNNPLIVERAIKKPVGKVWKALTNAKAISRWFFEIAEFKAEPGFKFKLTGYNDGVSYPSTCTVVEVKPEKLLSYTWSFDNYPAITLVIMELTPLGNETILKLTHEGLETLPENHPHFELHNFISGWQFFIDRLVEIVTND